MEKIYYKYRTGTRQSPICLVFLHEGLGSTLTWGNYPNIIGQNTGLNTLVYDRAGYGQSSGNLLNRPLNYLNLAAAELHQLLIDLKIQKVILYGHSDGGSIALDFAAKYPKMVHGIITEAAHVMVEKITIAGIELALKAYQLNKFKGLQKFHQKDYRAIFEAWSKTWLNPKFKYWNLLEELTLINSPKLVIQGTDDQYGTLKQVELITTLSKGNSITFIPKCGHSPFKEETELVSQKVIDFIKEVIN